MSGNPNQSAEPLVSTFERASSPDSELPDTSVRAPETPKPPNKPQNPPTAAKNSKKQKVEETGPKKIKIERVLSETVRKEKESRDEKEPGPSSTRDTEFDLNELKEVVDSVDKEAEKKKETGEVDPHDIWTAADDLSLLTAITHVACLRYTYNTMRFSHDVTFQELEKRYMDLAFNEAISARAQKRFDQMTDLQMLQAQSRICFTRAEEKCLVESAEQILHQMAPPKKGDKSEPVNHTMLRIEHFKRILDSNPTVFHAARTPQVLSDHFRRIKSYRDKEMLPVKEDERVVQPRRGVTSDADMVHLLEQSSSQFHLIKDNPTLNVILNNFKTSNVPDNAVAMIHGRFLEFAMIGKTALLGRAGLTETVDVDLSIEGPAAKVSRQQAIIRLNQDGEFTIENIGRRTLFVDGKTLVQGVATDLQHGSIIQVASISLLFSIPVPRTMHPITRQHAIANRRGSEASQRPGYQQLQKPQQQQGIPKRGRPIGGGGGSRPSSSNAGSMHSVVRRADPVEKERLLKAVAGIGH